ncbi:glycosyltransferase [Chamaesiphon sp. OTE_75_metabat_556]|uniref:glycosyltransferase n=1 Tax=Chamaesiphon sp. OTE_75_metabat_556 TaxID=2964692 RepID=UPI00286B7737|nr:glycosyltransferase [Chamaesiphon sp. OTE_75_metabat_556]
MRSFPDLRPGCDPVWLENRFRLFDRYCFPSVRNQSNQNFKWLVFFDADTPDAFKQKIAQYATSWENLVPLYVDFPLPYGQFPPAARELVRQVIAPDCEYLITTWLDNDDAIHQDYVDMIQDNFDRQEAETLNFIFGYQLSDGKLYFDFEMANHFISLVEKYDPQSFNTCLCRPHKEIYQVCKSAAKIICKPAWIEVVHGSNYMNVYRRGFRIPTGNILKEYGIETEAAVDREGAMPFWLEQAKISIFFPYYFLRKVFLRFKHKQLDEFKIGRLKFKNY